MKKIVLNLVLGISFFFISCDNADNRINEIDDGNVTNVVAKTNASVGELHNIYLDKLYSYLEGQNDLDINNIDSYTRQYFNSIDNGSDAIEYYNYVLEKQPIDYILSNEFKNEIENLDISLQNADFDNLDEFEEYVINYTPIYITNSIELEGWGYYTDILTHSVSYWTTNIDKWDNLIDTPVTLADKKPCKEGDWWKRTWCNVKRYGSKDAGAGATKIIVLLLESSAIVFGPVTGAALGASVGAIIVDLIF